jgi:hypothetical protein
VTTTTIQPPPTTHPFHSLNNVKEQIETKQINRPAELKPAPKTQNAAKPAPNQYTGNQPDRVKREARYTLGPAGRQRSF